MIVVKSASDAHQIASPAIRALVEQRIHALSEQGFALGEVGHFIVIDATDTLATIEQHLGVAISAYELMEEFVSCYDMVFILSDDGFGVEIFVPKELTTDANLIAMCRMHAYLASPGDAP